MSITFDFSLSSPILNWSLGSGMPAHAGSRELTERTSSQFHIQRRLVLPWNQPWGSIYTMEINKHCKSGLFFPFLFWRASCLPAHHCFLVCSNLPPFSSHYHYPRYSSHFLSSPLLEPPQWSLYLSIKPPYSHRALFVNVDWIVFHLLRTPHCLEE